MDDRTAISRQFAVNLLKAEETARALAESLTSINELVDQTRATITESRLVLAQADTLLADEIRALCRQERDQPLDPAATPMLAKAATRSLAE